MASEIWHRRVDIDRRERAEREKLLKEHNKKFSAERAALNADCEKIGHVEGNFHDNGWGWTWFYCRSCGGRMNEKRYSIQGIRADVVIEDGKE